MIINTKCIDGAKRFTYVTGDNYRQCNSQELAAHWGQTRRTCHRDCDVEVSHSLLSACGFPSKVQGAVYPLCEECFDDMYQSELPWAVVHALRVLFRRIPDRQITLRRLQMEALLDGQNICSCNKQPSTWKSPRGYECTECIAEYGFELFLTQANKEFLKAYELEVNIVQAWIDEKNRPKFEPKVRIGTSHHYAPREGGMEAAVRDAAASLMQDPGFMAWASSEYRAARDKWLDEGSPVEGKVEYTAEEAKSRFDALLKL